MSESGEYFLPPEALRENSEGFRGGILPKRLKKKKKHVLKLYMMTVQYQREYAYTLCQNEETSHSNKKHIPTPINMNTNIYIGMWENIGINPVRQTIWEIL